MAMSKRYVTILFTCIVAFAACFCLTGCGHNIVHTDRGLGMKLRIPLPDGGSLIDFAIGQIDSTTAVVRGNTTYSSSDTGGANITGAANLTQHIQLSSGPQLNEGNIVKVMTDPGCPAEAKVATMNMLSKQKAPEPQSTVSKTPDAAIASGGKEPSVELSKSTVATIMEGTPKVLESAAKPIEATAVPAEALTKPTADAIKSTVTEATDMLEGIAGKLIIAVIIVGVLLVIVGAYFLYKYIKYRIRKKDAGKSDEQIGSKGTTETVTTNTESGQSVDTGSVEESSTVQQETEPELKTEVSDQTSGSASDNSGSTKEEVSSEK